MNAPHVANEQGFTVTEVIIAIVVLSVGLLALASTAALTTRMIGRGQRSAVASTFAAQRLELLRPTACRTQVNGTEVLTRGSVTLATNTWRFSNPGNQTIRIQLVTTYLSAQGKSRTDTTETAVSCNV